MASSNAVAGPSHVGNPAPPATPQYASSSALLSLGSLAAYLPPDPVPPRPPSVIHPTQDLLGRYGIIPVYDEFVRPFNTAPIPVEDKGKRRDDGTAAADGADDTRSGPKEGLFQHGYKHFIKDLGLGKHNHKKDTFLSELVNGPEKQVVPIAKLDRTTLIHAFRLKEGGVPGFNTSQLTGDDKERKKKKKKRPIDPTQPGSQAGTPAAAPLATKPVTPAPAPVPAPIRRPAPSQLANGHVPAQTQSHPQSQSQPPAQQRPPPQPQRHPLPPNPKTAARPPGAGGAATALPTVKRKDREDGVTNGHAGGVIGGGGGSGAGSLKPAKKRKMDPMAFAPGHHVHPHQAIQQPTPHY